MSDQRKRVTLYGKSLPFEKAASAYTYGAITSLDDLRALQYAVQLMDWNMNKLVIIEITGLPEKTIERLIKRERDANVRSGRMPSSFGKIIQDPIKHLDASQFVVILRNYVDRVERIVTAHAFIEAYSLTRAAVGPDVSLTADEAWLVLAKRYAQKEIKLEECEHCTTPFVVSVEAVTVNRAQVHGDCPHCRQLAAKDGWSPVQLNSVFTSRSRALLRGYQGD